MPDPAPARGFSLATATFVIISSMVGGGIFTTSGYVALDLGSHELVLVVWMVGGLLAACGALTLAELSAALPRSGGEFVILGEAYGPLVGFLGGWVSLVMGFVAPIAATASAAAGYLLSPWPDAGPIALRAVGSVAILGFALSHARARSHTALVQGAITTATLAALALLIVAGVSAGWPHRAALIDRPPLDRLPGAAMFSSLILVSYCYTGWNAASYMAGEMDRPQEELPRAVILGTGVVIVLYVGLNLVYALALPIADLRAQVAARGDPDAVKPIAALAVASLFGPRWSGVAGIGLGLVILASLSALIATGPRVAFAMGRAGRLPPVFGRLDSRGEVPAAATLGVAAASLVVLWTGGFRQILLASGVGLALSSLLTISAVFVLRRARPDLHRPFRVPGYPLVPAAYLGFTATALTFAFLDPAQRIASLAGLGAVAAGVPAYYLSGWDARRRGSRVEG